MILKRLGIGKKSEYFLEAPPLSPNESGVDSKKAVSKSTKTESTPAGITPADVKAAEVAEAPVPSEVAAKPAVTASSDPKKKAAKAATKQVAAVSPVTEPITVNFATEYLIPKNTPRRRPGPSLDMFKDMAKQMNFRK